MVFFKQSPLFFIFVRHAIHCKRYKAVNNNYELVFSKK